VIRLLSMHISNVKAVVFDMDGVLIDTERLWRQDGEKYILQCAPKFTPGHQKYLMGRSLKDIYHWLEEDYAMTGIALDDFIQGYLDFGIEHVFSKCTLSPGIEDCLQRISATHPVALASASPHFWIDYALERFGIGQYFDAIISSDDVEGKGKPAPDIFLHAAAQINTAPEDCLVIEDSSHGIAAGVAAGMYTLAYINGYNDHQDHSAAHGEFSDFSYLTVE